MQPYKPNIHSNKDYQDIGVNREHTVSEIFRKKNTEMQAKYTREHKPYCFRCANLDFDDSIERQKQESIRSHGFINWKEISIEIPDLDKYGNINRFQFLKKSPIRQEKIIDGVRVPIVSAYWHEFTCKTRNCGHSVEVPLKDEALEQEKKIESEEVKKPVKKNE